MAIIWKQNSSLLGERWITGGIGNITVVICIAQISIKCVIPSFDFNDESLISATSAGLRNSLHLVGWQPTVANNLS